jgi:HSP20 family protein
MADPTKVPVKTESTSAPAPPAWRPFEALRPEVDRLFDDFDGGFHRWPAGRSPFNAAPFWRSDSSWPATPAVDLVETEKAYEVSAELPGLDEKNIEVKFAYDILTIKGERQEEKEEKKKDYFLHERSFGSFHRVLHVPARIDADKIEATFKKGVLTVTLPKSAEVQKAEKKIAVKAA